MSVQHQPPRIEVRSVDEDVGRKSVHHLRHKSASVSSHSEGHGRRRKQTTNTQASQFHLISTHPAGKNCCLELIPLTAEAALHRDGVPSAGSATSASPGTKLHQRAALPWPARGIELHQRAPLPRPAWGMSSISGLGFSARRGVTYLRRRGGEWLRTDESSTGERRWSEVGAAR